MSTRRQIEVAQVYSIAEGWTSGTRRDLQSREDALAEIHKVTTDPDVLAEAASVLLVPRAERAPDRASAALLVEAGADPAAVERWCATRRAKPRGFDLGAMADRGQKR